jgi:hypothetical protein
MPSISLILDIRSIKKKLSFESCELVTLVGFASELETFSKTSFTHKPQMCASPFGQTHRPTLKKFDGVVRLQGDPEFVKKSPKM